MTDDSDHSFRTSLIASGSSSGHCSHLESRSVTPAPVSRFSKKGFWSAEVNFYLLNKI